jgi:hypothetical protein
MTRTRTLLVLATLGGALAPTGCAATDGAPVPVAVSVPAVPAPASEPAPGPAVPIPGTPAGIVDPDCDDDLDDRGDD